MNTLETIHRTLIEYGFTCRYTGKRHRYHGHLECRGKPYPIWLEIPDPGFEKPPLIFLEERPPEIPLLCAHIGPIGDICYSSAGRDVMDPYRPAEQILTCVNDAEKVLCQALQGEHLADTQEEFPVYLRPDAFILCDIPLDKTYSVVPLQSIKRGGNHAFYLASNNPSLYEKAGYELGPSTAMAHCFYSRNHPIAAPGDWPPQDLGELVSWLRTFDEGRNYKAFRDSLEAFYRSKDNAFAFILRTPGHWWGVLFSSPPLERKNAHNAERWIKRLITSHSDWHLLRLHAIRTDPSYLVERNLGGLSGLSGKKILMIGCGTIGGYLADQLVRTGAGSLGGKLTVCDYDLLLPGNIGRHYLGLEYIHLNKAKALAMQLQRIMPHCQIIHNTSNATLIELDSYDLIIDATGAENFSLILNDKLMNDPKAPPAIYVWNEGRGVASQCLLVDSHDSACYRCLRDEKGSPRFSPLKDPTIDPFVAGTGCDDAYVPYPAMVSMQAAALAGRMAMDWANGRLGKRLRSITHNHDVGKMVPDKSPEKHSRCPACS